MTRKQSVRERFCERVWELFYGGMSIAEVAYALKTSVFEVEFGVRDFLDAREALAKRKLRAAKVRR